MALSPKPAAVCLSCFYKWGVVWVFLHNWVEREICSFSAVFCNIKREGDLFDVNLYILCTPI